MNIDNGHIVPWALLSDEQKESGRWVKLTDREYECAMRADEYERQQAMRDAWAKLCTRSTPTGEAQP